MLNLSHLSCSILNRSIGRNRCWLALGVVEFKVGADDAPLDALEELIHVGILVALILLEVGVLPHVNANDRCALHVHDAVHQWVILIIRLCDQEPAICTDTEPDPAWEHSRHACPLEGLLEAIEVGVELIDGIRKWPERLIRCIFRFWSQQAEHEDVVVDATQGQPLGRLIEASSLHVLRKLLSLELFVFLYMQDRRRRRKATVDQVLLKLREKESLYSVDSHLPGRS